MTRGDTIVPDVTQPQRRARARARDGDRTLADYERRGGLALLRDLPSLARVVEELKASGLRATAAPGSRPGSSGRRSAGSPACGSSS